MNNRRFKIKFVLLGLPALAGFFLLYLYPFIRTLWYSMIDNVFSKKFVLFDNYVQAFNHKYFKLAMKNTLIFSLIGVVLIVTLSLILSFGLMRLSRKFGFIRNLFIAPMILPTAGVIFAWHLAFQNDWYIALTKDSVINDFWIMLPIYLLFMWKYVGLNIIIISAALAGVEPDIKEAAALEGAKGFRLHRHITLPLISPSIIFVVVLSFVNALKSFRESYLFFRTDYPPDAAYTVQYYMNNHFKKLNYQNLTAGSVIFTMFIIAILLILYIWENKYNEKIY